MYLVQIHGFCYAIELYAIVFVFICVIDFFMIYFIFFILCQINNIIIYSDINSIVLGKLNVVGCVRIKSVLFSNQFK